MIAISGIAVGVFLALWFPGYIPEAYSTYVALAILACSDTILGGLKTRIKGTFNGKVFITGFCLNAVVAALFAWMGDLIGIDLFIAVIVMFGGRIFQNIAEIRRLLLNLDTNK